MPDALPYTVEVVFNGGTRREQRALRNSSNLYALRREPPSGIVGLLARARADVPRLTAALYREALYAGQISITIDGRPLASFSPFDDVSTRPVPVRVEITPREPFHFGALSAAPLPPGMTLKEVGLVPGNLADSDTIVAAETAIANGWRKLGHPARRGQRARHHRQPRRPHPRRVAQRRARSSGRFRPGRDRRHRPGEAAPGRAPRRHRSRRPLLLGRHRPRRAPAPRPRRLRERPRHHRRQPRPRRHRPDHHRGQRASSGASSASA